MNNSHSTRAHRNGIFASVTQSGDGRYIASAYPGNRHGEVTSNPVQTDLATIEDAKRVADKLAHPNCDGSCATWADGTRP